MNSLPDELRAITAKADERLRDRAGWRADRLDLRASRRFEAKWARTVRRMRAAARRGKNYYTVQDRNQMLLLLILERLQREGFDAWWRYGLERSGYVEVEWVEENGQDS